MAGRHPGREPLGGDWGALRPRANTRVALSAKDFASRRPQALALIYPQHKKETGKYLYLFIGGVVPSKSEPNSAVISSMVAVFDFVVKCEYCLVIIDEHGFHKALDKSLSACNVRQTVYMPNTTIPLRSANSIHSRVWPSMLSSLWLSLEYLA